MSWGKWIIVAFALFAGFIATLVVVCMNQDVSLVSKDYYTDELNFQEQIARMNNVNQLEEKPVIKKSGNHLVIGFNKLNEIENGELKLFSPSNAAKDKTFNITRTKEAQELFSLADVAKGMYRARMQWAMNGREYFLETVIYI
jgi:hypothetical protein